MLPSAIAPSPKTKHGINSKPPIAATANSNTGSSGCCRTRMFCKYGVNQREVHMKLPDIEKASPDELAKLSESNKAVADLLVEQTLQDLAKLSPMDYDRQREATAKTLGVRVATLDAEVESRRPVTAKPNGNGASILLPDVE